MSHKKSGPLLHRVLVTEGVKRELEKQRASTSQNPPTTQPAAAATASASEPALSFVQGFIPSKEEATSSTKALGDDPLPGRPAMPVWRPFPLNLPPDHDPGAQDLYYGYHITDKWMEDYLASRVGTHIDEEEMETMHPTDAIVLGLQRETGIRTPLLFKTAFVDPTNEDLTRWENPPRIPFIAITSNASVAFDRRPPQEYVDKLTELLGIKPRWWHNCWVDEQIH